MHALTETAREPAFLFGVRVLGFFESHPVDVGAGGKGLPTGAGADDPAGVPAMSAVFNSTLDGRLATLDGRPGEAAEAAAPCGSLWHHIGQELFVLEGTFCNC